MSKFYLMSVAAVVGMFCLGVSTAQACERGAVADGVQKVHAAGKRRCGPPEVALQACEGLSENAQCSFLGRRGDSLNGQCRVVADASLACVPEGHRHGKSSGTQQ